MSRGQSALGTADESEQEYECSYAAGGSHSSSPALSRTQLQRNYQFSDSPLCSINSQTRKSHRTARPVGISLSYR